ncbi:hypothetical protein EVAR_75248_1 [Eumeta japonica]|uniref:Uncharacterized protein n=1 Tax=Eumeta variegata TaxID=151549 RepID=A0A4C1VBR2_EUMVA|nr:hypothetical protein EVAR_75248_1 [Eumeta japonica]
MVKRNQRNEYVTLRDDVRVKASMSRERLVHHVAGFDEVSGNPFLDIEKELEKLPASRLTASASLSY